jgi:molecular chaperone GrpE
MGDKKKKIEIKVADEDSKIEEQENNKDSDIAEAKEDKKEERPEKKTPEQLIQELEEKLKEQEDRYLRLVAEFDNFKKRNARQYEIITQSAKESLITQFLEVIDNLERAIGSTENSDLESFKKGTNLIYQQLSELLKKEGIEAIETVGKEFDPNLHEAMLQVESEKHPEGAIVDEMVKGYKLNDKVIRFSKVTVSKGAKNDAGD